MTKFLVSEEKIKLTYISESVELEAEGVEGVDGLEGLEGLYGLDGDFLPCPEYSSPTLVYLEITSITSSSVQCCLWGKKFRIL